MQKKAQQFGAEFLKKLKCITKKLSGFMKYEKKLNTVRRTGFDLTTYDSYFMILVQVFTNHTLAENIFHESFSVNRTHDNGPKNYKQVQNYSRKS